MLHWHWFIPVPDGLGDQDDQHNPLDERGLHAHLPDGLEPDWSGHLITDTPGSIQILAGEHDSHVTPSTRFAMDLREWRLRPVWFRALGSVLRQPRAAGWSVCLSSPTADSKSRFPSALTTATEDRADPSSREPGWTLVLPPGVKPFRSLICDSITCAGGIDHRFGARASCPLDSQGRARSLSRQKHQDSLNHFSWRLSLTLAGASPSRL